MGLLDLHAAQAGISEPPLQTVPRTIGERVEATVAETFAPDRYFTIANARQDMWQRAIDEIHAATGQSFINPYDSVTYDEAIRPDYQPGAIVQQRQQKIIEAARMARAAGNDQLFDPENIDRYIEEEARRRRDTSARMQGTGNGILNFLAAAGLETVTPHGLVGLAIPVTRLPSAAASSVGRTFLANVGREAAFQARANSGLQAIAEGLDATTRTDMSLGESLTNIAGAAVIGGAIGGGARALHLKWLGLPEAVRAAAPLEVQDAFKLIEADALYSGQNRLGVDPLLHERYQGNAMDAVMRGRPVDLADLSRGADTPMTALGTILRQQTDRIDMPRLVGTPDEGMRDVFARAAALPTSEIEAFAREISPRSFQRLDRVEGELAAARAQLAEINDRAPSIGDLLDLETGMRLQEIEGDLAAPALTRKQRTALEQEREMILSTVDPRDRLPKQAEKAQRAARAEIEKQIAKLEKQRTEAVVTAEKATADLSRKLGRYADAPGFGPVEELSADLAPQTPDLAAAIMRAETMRQARMVREVLPEGIGPEFKPASVRVDPDAPTETTPEIAKAMDTEAARVLETRPDLEVEISGRTMSAREAMEDADRMAKDAQAALGCAIGAL